MTIDIKLLQRGDAHLLEKVAPGVFDHEIDPRHTEDFLESAHHHLAVALENQVVVGMASAVHHHHPDKAAQLWINEVCVARSHRRVGVGTRLLRALIAEARRLRCTETWVLTERSNPIAMRFYESIDNTARPDVALMYTFRL